ncbi:MAG: 2-amino-4-hydroxy-6-hydroxymethyldihydropteridine diphosphokinase [Deltaproteobacteria bacterium]|nr:2-amino-4-hydroxy-6-hydroxymethyldihydropteridine diphosphokinase [Deltaproteobacteria bacterium]
MSIATIAFGSNIQPEHHLPLAVKELARLGDLVKISAVYRTPPWGYIPQPYFLNGALWLETPLPPVALMECLLAIEQQLGRVRTLPCGPRTLDLDLVFHGNHKMSSPRLTLPHPRWKERPFVLVPLADLFLQTPPPGESQSVTFFLSQLDVSGIQKVGLSLIP